MIIIDTQAMVLIGRKLHVQKGMSFSITELKRWSPRQIKRISREVRRLHAKHQSEQYFDPSKEEGRQEGIEAMTQITRKLGRQFGLIRYLVKGEETPPENTSYIPDIRVPWNERYVKYDEHTERYIAEELKKDAEFRLKERLEQGISIENWDPTYLKKNELYRQRWYLARTCWYRKKQSYERKQLRASYRRGLRAGMPTTPEQLTLAEMLKFDRMLNEIDGCENEIIMSLNKIPVKEFFLQCEQNLKLLTKVESVKSQSYSGSEFSSEREVFESENDQWDMTDRQRVDIMRKCLVAGSGTPPNARQRRNQKRRQQAKQTQPRPVKPSPVRPSNALVGKGEYSFAEKTGRSIGGFIGKSVGQLAEHLLSGFGDYTVDHNSLLTGGMDPPSILNAFTQGAVVVRHREYIGDVFATQAFNITSYPINPGISSTFPWLAQIAESFEQYRLDGMVFEFKTTSSDVILSSSANTALGTVIMATQYNALDVPFVDKRTMENYQYASSSKPSCSMLHPIECARMQTPVDNMYIRTGVVPTGADQRLYDMGSFQIATTGMQANGGVIGELWCSFEVSLFKPKLLLGDILTDHYHLGTVTNGAPLGTTSVLVGTSTLGTTITGAGLVITFPATVVDGNFMLNYSCFGTGAAITQFNLPTQFNCAALRVWEDDTNLYEGIRSATTTNVYTFTQLIQVQGPSATLTFAAAVLPTVVTHGDLWITQVSEAVVT